MTLPVRTALSLAFALFLAFLAGTPAFAACTGRDLIAAMAPADRAAIEARAAAAPFSTGNFWTARKGALQATIAGTYHLDDPRFGSVMARLAPELAAASTLLVEAGPDEMASLQATLKADPGRIVSPDGASLYEELPRARWDELARQMSRLGLPGPVVARLQPWYVMILLGMTGCNGSIDPAGGLDMQLMAAAKAKGVPIRALEPADMILTLFSGVSRADQLALLTTALGEASQEGDGMATLTEAYFRGQSRLMWEFTVWETAQLPGVTPAEALRQEEQMELLLITGRNRAWVPRIEAAAKAGPVFVAVGALHLPGQAGVLNLLAQDGWQITPLAP